MKTQSFIKKYTSDTLRHTFCIRQSHRDVCAETLDASEESLVDNIYKLGNEGSQSMRNRSAYSFVIFIKFYDIVLKIKT